jgi:type IV secretion system protein TrbJ
MTWSNRRATLVWLLSSLATATFPASASRAQMAVFDPTNYAQNVLQAARALQQINNQITSLQNQAQSLINQARNLTRLPVSVLSQIQQTINQTRALIQRAQNIAYDVGEIDRAFRSLYGSVSMTASDASLVTDAQSRWRNTVAGLQDAMRTQATVLGNSATYQAQLSTLVTASQTADGALAATQAGNQLLALQAQQLGDLTALLASQARAQNLKAAEDATAAAQATEQRRRFLQSRTGYQQGNAKMFYER